MTDQGADPFVLELREQISDVDRSIIEAINARLELVARLKSYKTSRGYEFVDLAREEWQLECQSRANRGPLSQEGLRAIYSQILDLTKQEVARAEESASA